ncbi:MAG TPA: hypothetical protein DFS52_02710, partial [Myxococcales bacterium]|nr:hypothetical protein [Myxococcales bacterium]
PSPLAVSVPAAKPVPKGFTDEPIEENELLRRPPPPKTEPKRSAKKRSSPVQCSSPGGFTLTLPATWSRGARAGAAQLFNSNDRRFVL